MTQFFAKKLNKKGFTLAELLIVIAIIAILVAIAIPIFTSEMNKAKVARDKANIRAIKAAGASIVLGNDNVDLTTGPWYVTATITDGDIVDGSISVTKTYSGGYTAAKGNATPGQIDYNNAITVELKGIDLSGLTVVS